MSTLDDELDAELRRLLGDDRLAIQPKAGAEQAIVTGARRLRRRREVLTAMAGVTMAAVLVAGGLTLGDLRVKNSAVAVSGSLETGTTSVPSGRSSDSAPSGDPAPGGTVLPPPRLTQDGNKPPERPSQAPPVFGGSLTGPRIGPRGYGNLRVGMTAEEAAAAGVVLILTSHEDDVCQAYSFSGAEMPSGGSVLISPRVGIAQISPAVPVVTPEGVGPGALRSKIFDTYPGSGTDQEDSNLIHVRASEIAGYSFWLDDTHRVARTTLEKADQDCFG